MGETNLNDSQIATDYGPRSLENHGAISGSTRVMFRGLADELTRFICGADLIVGCVAWLTHPGVLDALSTPECGSAIVVQKEDFLRPDIGQRNRYDDSLRRRYEQIRCRLSRYELGSIVSQLSVCNDPTMQGVRCVGNHNRDKGTNPRMHHKFIVACHVPGGMKDDVDDDSSPFVFPIPRAVWTGSFNFTRNAMFSFENAVIIKDERVARAYFDEWQQIEALSEPLDWTSEWIEPEWRIGT